MAKKINVTGDNPCPCYLKIQRSERLDDGTESYRIYELTDETRDRIRQYSDWRVGTIPQKRASGQINIFTSLDGATYPNALSYLKAIAKGIPDGPHYLETRDNQVVIRNSKDIARVLFRYTYAGGTGELLEATIGTKYSQSIEAVKSSEINPDTKEVKSEVTQCIASKRDDCIDGYRRKREEPRELRDVTRMEPYGYQGDKSRADEFFSMKVESGRVRRSSLPMRTYSSLNEAKQEISANPQLTSNEVYAYQNQMKAAWDSYNQAMSEYESKMKQGEIGTMPEFPDISTFTIKRKVRVMLQPMDYASKNAQATYGGGTSGMYGLWRDGYKALKKDPNIMLIDTNKTLPQPYTYFTTGDISQRKKDSMVEAVMEIDIPLPGIRVVADSKFVSSGDISTSDLVESVSTQITLKAQFVGNPLMESSQNVHIKNIGNTYSGVWYAKEVEHVIDSNGYFTNSIFRQRDIGRVLSVISTTKDFGQVYREAHEMAVEAVKKGSFKQGSQILTQLKSEYERDTAGSNDPLTRINIIDVSGDTPTVRTIYNSKMDLPLDGITLEELKKISE